MTTDTYIHRHVLPEAGGHSLEGHLHIERVSFTPEIDRRTAGRRLLRATLAAAGAAALANAVIGRSAAAAFDIPPEFLPLSPGATVVVSLGAALAAGATLALLGRVTPQPARWFLAVAVVTLALSFVPNVGLALADPAPYAGVTPQSMGALAFMHLAEAGIVVSMLLPQARKKRS